MTDMQTSLPLLIVRPSILNPVINFSTHLWPGKWKALQIYLCHTHFIPSPPMLMQHMHQHDQQWYDPLHIITWSYWFIDLDFTCSSPLRRSISAKSCSSFTITRGPSLQSLRLALHTCNRSIKPSYVLIFSTLITWLMSYFMCNELLHQHMYKLCNIFEPSSPSWHMLLTHMYLWTNLLCISHKHN
jgi:hypothetical protein